MTNECSICSTDLSRWRREIIRLLYKTHLLSNIRLSCGHWFHTECAQQTDENCRVCGNKSTSFDVFTLCRIVRPHNDIRMKDEKNTNRKNCFICSSPIKRYVFKHHAKSYRYVKKSLDITLECGHVFHANRLQGRMKLNSKSPCCQKDCTKYCSVSYTKTSAVYASFNEFVQKNMLYYVPGKHNFDGTSGQRSL